MAESLAAALAELQANPPRIRKTSRGQVGGRETKYANLPNVHKILKPLLTSLGLLWDETTGYANPKDWGVLGTLTHVDTGQSKEGFWPVTAADPQKQGSAVTYARRYLLVTMTGVIPEGDDDDGHAASEATETPQQTRAKVTGPEHERIRYGAVEAAPGDRPADRGPIPETEDPWLDQPPGSLTDQPEDQPGSIKADPALGRAIHSLFNKLGITDRTERLETTRGLLGLTELATSNDLSLRQASNLRRQLEAQLRKAQT